MTSVSPDSACSRRKPFAGLIGPRPALLVWCSPEGTDLALSVGHWKEERSRSARNGSWRAVIQTSRRWSRADRLKRKWMPNTTKASDWQSPNYQIRERSSPSTPISHRPPVERLLDSGSDKTSCKRAHDRSRHPWSEIARCTDCYISCRRPDILSDTLQARAAPLPRVPVLEHSRASSLPRPQSKAPTKSSPLF